MPTATAKRREAAAGVIASNRHARHEYEILETFEAGLELHGTEVKALRAGRTQLREGYIRIENGEAWLVQVHISPYDKGNVHNHEPDRKRRLLLHKRQIDYLQGRVMTGGLTLVPLRMYAKGNRIKLELGLARGRKLWDKRQSMAERDARRDVERITKAAMR
jgi:SsrA-binding protein